MLPLDFERTREQAKLDWFDDSCHTNIADASKGIGVGFWLRAVRLLEQAQLGLLNPNVGRVEQRFHHHHSDFAFF